MEAIIRVMPSNPGNEYAQINLYPLAPMHHCDFQTRDETYAAIFEYIEVFYNRSLRHQALGYVIPVQFEQAKEISRLSVIAIQRRAYSAITSNTDFLILAVRSAMLPDADGNIGTSCAEVTDDSSTDK